MLGRVSNESFLSRSISGRGQPDGGLIIPPHDGEANRLFAQKEPKCRILTNTELTNHASQTVRTRTRELYVLHRGTRDAEMAGQPVKRALPRFLEALRP